MFGCGVHIRVAVPSTTTVPLISVVMMLWLLGNGVTVTFGVAVIFWLVENEVTVLLAIVKVDVDMMFSMTVLLKVSVNVLMVGDDTILSITVLVGNEVTGIISIASVDMMFSVTPLEIIVLDSGVQLRVTVPV